MKQIPTFFISVSYLLLITFTFGININCTIAQNTQDSSYLPKIYIGSLNGWHPYIIGTERTNLFIADTLPPNTSKITFRFIDSNGEQVSNSYTEEGQYLTTVFWECESDTMDLPLSPQLSVEVHYQTDSVAVYNIPYIVYPDTVKFMATKGWGPFVTNNYTFADTSWHNVPELYNTFTATNFPPRTDSVKFTIFSADSIAIDSSLTIATNGQYLDSAAFENVRMDLLPLSTAYIEVAMFCEGGPYDGIVVNKDLTAIQQTMKFICKTDEGTFNDSLPLFIQNQTAGQALAFDSTGYAKITNGPGEFIWWGSFEDEYLYRGPISIDILKGVYTIEAWVKFDPEKIEAGTSDVYTNIITVDSVFSLVLITGQEPGISSIDFLLNMPTEYEDIFSVDFSNTIFNNTQWHHVALTFNGQGQITPRFYFDGQYIGATVHQYNIDYIFANIDYEKSRKTKPLTLGLPFSGYITALDEVRIWNDDLSQEEIIANMHRSVLQDERLLGCWNFDDKRNHHNTVSDISYYNNSGILNNGASFIPQDPVTEHYLDTLTVLSSNSQTDSIKFTFVDKDDIVILSDMLQTNNGQAILAYDISTLPYRVERLLINEYYPGCPDSGYISGYNFDIVPPTPIATSKHNWGTIYQSDDPQSVWKNNILVSGLPKNTRKVELGLEKDGILYDTVFFTKNSVPYRYSLALNGEDNFIETSQEVSSPTDGVISFWFKTISTEGGKLIGFSETQNGANSNHNDLEIIIEKNGMLRFILDTANSVCTLYANHPYNDNEWHSVSVTFNSGLYAELSVDGSPVDKRPIGARDSYSGYWIIGRNPADKSLAEYFKGSFAEIHIQYENKTKGELLYQLDDGSGTVVSDSKGDNNGILKGTIQQWFRALDKLSFVNWEANLINKQEGIYTFFARVFYPGAHEEGTYYALGKFNIKDPLPGYNFSYNFGSGTGYFNEGTSLTNTISFETDLNYFDTTDWAANLVQVVFLTPGQQVVRKETYTYTGPTASFSLDLDMGDAPHGSYVSIQMGYKTVYNSPIITQSFPVPIHVNQMTSPTLKFDPGPFKLAIAPGTMSQENIFVITTGDYDDLNKITGKFYTIDGKQIAEANAEQKNDTTWHLKYDMSILAAPETHLKIGYYLGNNPDPTLIEGPHVIKIDDPRPPWFDFIADSSFHDVWELDGRVFFTLASPLEKNKHSDNYKIPEFIPFIGGSKSYLKTESVRVDLAYIVSKDSLILNQPPVFYQNYVDALIGPPQLMEFDFHYDNNSSYYIDKKKNLFLTQNFAIGYDVTFSPKKLEEPFVEIVKLIKRTKALTPGTVISPVFDLTFTSALRYSTRLHTTYDNNTGKWGSYGDLDVDANPADEEAFKKSASYKFVAGDYGLEISVGASLFHGLTDVMFGLEGRLAFGGGKSYVTIPQKKEKKIFGGGFQIYGRVYLTAVWGWYEKNLWGPMLFLNKTFGHDMTNAFPPPEKGNLKSIELIANPALADSLFQLEPVGWFQKIPMPIPQQSIDLKENHRLFTWLEPGKAYGERNLKARHFNTKKGKFEETVNIADNKHAIHNPSISMLNDHTIISAWVETRHTPVSISKIQPDEVAESFSRSKDIWYSIYDIDLDSTILITPIEDDFQLMCSGRAETNPELTVISNNRAILTWQVVNIDIAKSEIWYVLIEKNNGQWQVSDPTSLANTEGIQTEIEVASPTENMAVAVWKNTDSDNTGRNRLLTSIFDGTYWTVPNEIFTPDTNTYYGDFDLDFENEKGAIAYTTYSTDTTISENEALSILTWDQSGENWDTGLPVVLYADSAKHIKLPRISINDEGRAAIGFKLNMPGPFLKNKRISQVDLMVGDISNPLGNWEHIKANKFVCDTTKEVSDLDIAFAGNDTIMILSYEFIMAVSNMPYTPTNGIRFGNPYMNLVLRSIKIDKDGNLDDVNENIFFDNGNDTIISYNDVVLEQNYPNPCSSSTTIKFYLPVKTNARLEIFNINGLKVRDVVDQELGPGNFEVKLNTASLGCGIYVYKLTTDKTVNSMKMIVGN